MFVKFLPFLIVFSFLIGCSTEAKDPYSANTLEILFGNNVENYLAGRRLELQNLQGQASKLDDDILGKLGELFKIEKELENARLKTGKSDKKLAEFQQEVSRKKAEAEAAFEKTSALKLQIETLQSDQKINATTIERDKSEIAGLKEDLTQLEAENKTLDRAIRRNLNLKAEQLLRNDG